ncbi:MAG: hypothetical protein ACK5HS_04590 [Mycoplasmatales bacterium]
MSKKRKPGRPKGSTTAQDKIKWDEVEKLYALGMTDESVASFFGIERNTLYADKEKQQRIKKRGMASAEVSARRLLFNQAEKGNTSAIIFLNKNISKMSDFGQLEDKRRERKLEHDLQTNNQERDASQDKDTFNNWLKVVDNAIADKKDK